MRLLGEPWPELEPQLQQRALARVQAGGGSCGAIVVSVPWAQAPGAWEELRLAGRDLGWRGHVYVAVTAADLPHALTALSEMHLEPKRVIVRYQAPSSAALIVAVAARRGGLLVEIDD